MTSQAEIDRRVTLARCCLHARGHYLDENGNRRCYGCDACVRPHPLVPVLPAPKGAV